MIEHKKKTIFRKIIFWIVSFSCIAGLSFSVLLFFVLRSDSIFNIQKIEMEKLSRKEEILKRIYEENINDLETIPNLPALKKFIEGQKEGTLSVDEKQSAIEALKILAETKNHYLQLRLIDAEGQEKLRVERKDDGTIYVVPDSQLQNKANRYYFSQSYSLNKGEYYVSPIDLNREGVEQKIEIPYRPVVRYATPVFSKDGSKYGIFIINNDFTRILKKIQDSGEKGSTFLIVDSDGNYVWHPDPNLRWSGPKDLDRKKYFLSSNPTLWKSVKESSEGTFSLGDYFVYKKIELSFVHDFPTFFVISQIDQRSVLVPVYYKIFIIALAVVFGTFVFSLLAFFAVRRILKPLRKLKVAAEQVEIGNFDVQLDVKTGDEIEEFARIFSKMVKKVGDAYRTLGEKVKEKTETLEKQKIALESQVKQMNDMQKASLNLLEDLDFEKEKMLKQIRETDKFRMAVDNASDQIVITDADGIVLYANKALKKITGYSPEEALGKKAAVLWKIPMPPEFYKNMWHVIKTEKKEFKSQLKNRNKNGTEYEVELIINPVLDEHGDIMFFVGIERDITQEKMVDRAKTEFVSIASHQLRTPLSAINWYLEILLDESNGKLTQEQKNYINEVYAGSKRMVDLVNALLNVSRIDLGTFAVDPQPVDIKEISESVFFELAPALAEKQMKIEKNYDEKLPIINADPKLMRIVFQNLLSNALKYTPEKGTISVKVEKKKNEMLLTVSDTGYGIPPEQKDRIFEKLFRADNIREKIENGTGLGLYIVKSIVEQSQGKIWFDSQLNKGTNFYVSIPLAGMKKKEGTKGLSEG